MGRLYVRRAPTGVGVASLVALISASPVLAGPDWLENGDAGSTLADAQVTLGAGPLTTIEGTLSVSSGLRSADLEDVYLIQIAQPTTFTFEILNASFNASLFLFNITLANEAFGLLANLDRTASDNSPRVVTPATDGSGAQVLLPGIYAIGIAGDGRVPIGLNGNIFSFASNTEVSGNDGPGGINPLSGWTGDGQVGGYSIEMRGVGFADVPAPASAGILLGLALAGRRRRSENS